MSLSVIFAFYQWFISIFKPYQWFLSLISEFHQPKYVPKNCWWSVQAKKNILSVKLHFYQFLISSFPLISDLRQFSYSNSERASNSTCFDISFVKIGAGLCEISQIAVLRRRNCVGGFFWWHRVETLNQTRCAKFQLIPTIFQFYRGHPTSSPAIVHSARTKSSRPIKMPSLSKLILK